MLSGRDPKPVLQPQFIPYYVIAIGLVHTEIAARRAAPPGKPGDDFMFAMVFVP